MKPFLIAFILLALSCKDHKESITTETPVDSLGFSFSKQKTKDDILNIAKSQTVRIVISFINNEKKMLHEFGMGMVLNGVYLASCYHLFYKENSSYKYSNAYLVYNERFEEDNFMYDTISLIKNFKPDKNQYNFSDHIFDPNDRSTDFIVLKLNKPLKPVNYSFSTRAPKYLDTTYSYGNVLNDKILNPAFQDGLLMFNHKEAEISDASYFGYISSYTYGFSGSPLYNTQGEILGMIQLSFEYFPKEFLNKIYAEKKINEQFYKSIERVYNEGKKIQFAIDFNFLKEKYLIGYL